METLATNEELINKGFSMVHEEFIKQGWFLKKNEINSIIYKKDEYPSDDFTIKVSSNNILVSVPLSNSNYFYKASFNNYFEACEYLSLHLTSLERNYKAEKKYNSEDDI